MAKKGIKVNEDDESWYSGKPPDDENEKDNSEKDSVAELEFNGPKASELFAHLEIKGGSKLTLDK